MSLAFDPDSLLGKAKLYIRRAFDEDREDYLFPFWLSLSLELLARSTLAKISPALLAEVGGGNDGTHLLYSLGYPTTQKPRSIAISIAFERLTKIGIGFTDDEKKVGDAIVNQRNVEVHSGQTGFEDFPVSVWLGDYYRICKILLLSQNLELKDLLGSEEAEAAEIMITDKSNEIRRVISEKIRSYRTVFLALPIDEQERRSQLAADLVRTMRSDSKSIICPSCKSIAVLSGEQISASPPKLIEGIIRQEIRYLPSNLSCSSCNLIISSYLELKEADLGNQFTISEELDPVDYHQIEVSDYVDVDEILRNRYAENQYMDE